jgi:coenzyme PQQ precursor peptide PqqA
MSIPGKPARLLPWQGTFGYHQFERPSRNFLGAVCVGSCRPQQETVIMIWTTPILAEICIGLEINGYLPAEI